MDLRRELPEEVSRIAADFSTAALALVQDRLLPLGLVAEIFASGLARIIPLLLDLGEDDGYTPIHGCAFQEQAKILPCTAGERSRIRR